MLDLIPKNFNRSIILSGSTGNFIHIYEGLGKRKVDAISTANLLNFVGDGLIKTRLKLISKKIPFPDWDTNLIKQTENFLNKLNEKNSNSWWFWLYRFCVDKKLYRKKIICL